MRSVILYWNECAYSTFDLYLFRYIDCTLFGEGQKVPIFVLFLAFMTDSGGGLSGGIRGTFSRLKGPFTPSQWMELEHQALIYKHIVANVPVPSNLLVPLKRSLYSYGSPGSYASNFCMLLWFDRPNYVSLLIAYFNLLLVMMLTNFLFIIRSNTCVC